MNKTKNIRRFARGIAVAVVAVLCSQTASAHHSFGKFDMAKLTTLTGTVRGWAWTNPHTWLTLVVKKPNGTTEEWSLVGSSPNMMSRWGWKAADVKVGDKIVIDVHPGRDGTHIGALKNVFLTGGKVLSDPAGSSGQDLAGGPAKVPSKPEGTPYK